ncbi:MAG: sugar phosphate isomerase/epimerase family protein [Oscillospiraceae bacterium]|nr:sugar phosphate isomerase/epimerase family protein [Oscillospiraceae bacterium]
MKLGLVSAILADSTFEEVIELTEKMEMRCVELMCWPRGKAIRRYAGVTHIDINELTKEKADYCRSFAQAHGVEISALGYYPNTMDADPEKREIYIEHIYRLIDAAKLLEVNRISTFIGRDTTKNPEDNIELMLELWTPIVKYAYEQGVQVAIENCPMFYTKDEWPDGTNLATCPYIWRTMFERIPYPNFGLNYDPSHMLLQGADYIRPLYDFRERIFHVHLKDIKMNNESIYQYGMFNYPAKFHSPKIIGLGDIDWSSFVSALHDIRYNGYVCIEIEDKAFESCPEDILKSISLSRKFISNYMC